MCNQLGIYNFDISTPCSIVKHHAVIECKDGQYEIKPASTGAKIKVNGSPVTGTQTLENKDRILFGESTNDRQTDA